MDLTLVLQLWLGRFLEPISAAARSPLHRRELLVGLGLDSAAVAAEELDDALKVCAELAHTIIEHDLSSPTPELLLRLLEEGGQAIKALTSVAASAGTIDLERRSPEVLLNDLLSLLLVRFLRTYVPLAHDAAALLTLLRLPEEGGARMPRLELGIFADLFRDPAETLLRHYLGADGWGGLLTAADARRVADRLFPRLAAFLERLGLHAHYARDPRLQLPDAPGLADRMLLLQLPLGGGAGAGVAVSIRSAEEGGAMFLVSPFGSFAFTHRAAEWTATLTLRGELRGFGVGPDGVEIPDTTEDFSAGAELILGKASKAGGAAFRSAPAGTRMEIGTLQFRGVAVLGKESEAGLEVEVSRAAFVVAPPESDGFLKAVLPSKGVGAEFDLALGWSTRRGLYFRGGAGLEVELPVQATLGPLTIPSIFLGLHAGDSGLQLEVAATAGVRLGPVRATVERVGLEGDLTFPEGGGNIGPAQLALGFRPPSGAGLVLDAGPLAGGGYLSFDRKNQQYAGVVQLEFKGIALKAIGLITTRMPDGRDGFSLLLIISAEFTPIQLGYGFTLNGVGGLLGVNRTAVVDVLRAGIKARTLDSIMFPRDPVANAPQLISNLSAVFPPAPGRFVFGPMARLGWGTPTLVTLDLGLILELPAPVRLIVLGRLRMALPHEQVPIVTINMDVLGIIDFERGEASVDATLYDSTIAGFVLTGDMAMRMSWGDRPGFALAAGGFHPRFQPPPGFPTLERLALTLCTGNNPRLRLEAYLALTSNTAQFGARLDLYAAAHKFSIEGVLAFDALFQFEPFSLLAEMSGMVALKQGSRKLMGVTVQVTLTGPSPWHARGYARFELLFITAEVGFDIRVGAAAMQPAPAPVEVAPLVEAALKEPRSWSTQLPPEGESLVTVREIPRAEGELLIHPLATFSVTQRVAPLGRELQRFGAARIFGATRMEITRLRVGDINLLSESSEPIQEYFAPAQFLDLSDAEKLARPSFERWEGGRRAGGRGVSWDTAKPFEAALEPEAIIIDAPDVPARLAPEAAPMFATSEAVPAFAASEAAPTTMTALQRFAASGAAARAETRSTGPGRFRGPVLKLGVTG